MHPAIERQCYIVTLSPIGWVHAQNDPCSIPVIFQILLAAFYLEMKFSFSEASKSLVSNKPLNSNCDTFYLILSSN